MPTSTSSSTGKRSGRSRFPNLRIDTKSRRDGGGGADDEALEDPNNTPATSTSTDTERSYSRPSSSKVRTRGDIRSPGAKATPRNAASTTAPPPVVPDFITQTDKDGNATTPRHAPPASKADAHDLQHNDPFDVCLESLRSMCCCLLEGEDAAAGASGYASSKDRRKRRSGGGSGGASTSEGGRPGMLLPTDPNDPDRVKLLPAPHPQDKGKKCLVLDLDETLVHSSFRAVPGADFVIPVQIEDVVHFVYVAKRPGVDEFLLEMAKYYEIVVYTASLNKYADPLLDLLDPHRVIRTRLFRESCVYFEGNYVKDLSLIDRELAQSIIVDNSPNSYLFHPENAIDCSSFIDDPADRELAQIGGFLKSVHDAEDVRGICSLWKRWPDVDFSNVKRLSSSTSDDQ